MEHFRFLLESDKDVAGEISASLVDKADAQVEQATRRALDGSPETVIQIVQVGLQSLSVVLPLVMHWVSRDRIRKVRFGDVEIENPTPEQVQALWERHLADDDET